MIGTVRSPNGDPTRPDTSDATTRPVDRREENGGNGASNGRRDHIERRGTLGRDTTSRDPESRTPETGTPGSSASAGARTAGSDESDSTVTDIMSRVGRALPVADGHGDRHDGGDEAEPDVRERDEASETTAVRVVALADVAEEPEGKLARRGETTEAS